MFAAIVQKRASPVPRRHTFHMLTCSQATAPAPATQTAPKEVCRVAVLGASGYTGAEVVRLSALHPHLRITALTGEKQAGKVRNRSATKIIELAM